MRKSKFDRRQILAATGATSAAAILPTRVFGQAIPELQTMRSTAKSWLWAAEDYANAGGFFDKAKVKVVSNASNRGTNIAALAGSGVDIVLGDPGEALRARGQNLPIKTFIGTVNKYASNVVIKKDILAKAGVDQNSPIDKKIAAMKGLKLGTTGPGAAPDALFRWLCVEGNMDPNKDITLVPIQGGGPGMLAGLQQNVIDGFCLSSPTSDLAVQDRGCAYLFNMAVNPPAFHQDYLYICATVHENTIANKDKREAIVRYCHGVALALRDIQSNPTGLKAWADKWFEGLPPQIAQQSFDINSKIFFPNPVPTSALFQKNIDFINTVQKTMNADPLPNITFDQLFDAKMAQEAMSRV
ncbi:MAG: ABC transporter substrate-binding protein [Gammaproteobacteria bacterium]|nr:ABC transporter substrate-binding protein [Gammaproteobacteria bacterium]